MTRRPGPFAAFLLISLCSGPTQAGEGPGAGLSLSDLAAYRAALEPDPARPAAVRATFRDLWDHPERFEGMRVRVEGRVVRRFRQGAFGTFPALAEVWAVAKAGDPFCLVFPDPPVADPGSGVAPGASVRFEGTFLRQLRYQGGDAARLAPLIVGDRPPSVASPPPSAPEVGLGEGSSRDDRTRLAWTLGLVAASVVGLALARRHLQGPPRPPPRSRGGPEEAPPEFVDNAWNGEAFGRLREGDPDADS